MSNEPKIIVTRPMVGLCGMQVCVEEGITDEEILEHCNVHNPSGTSNGWNAVIRDEKDCEEHNLPVESCTESSCSEYPNRTHFLVLC